MRQDLLAVAYGQFEFTNQGDGLILFWSLKNPEYPERVYRTQAGVMSLAFSERNPSLLAAGLYDGSVLIYDVRKDDEKPMLESGCVWAVAKLMR
jgi:dynein intermediate chain 4, axonemal